MGVKNARFGGIDEKTHSSYCIIPPFRSKNGGKMKTKTYVISILLFFLVFFMFVSCGKHEAKWKGTIEEVDGITVVKNPKEPIYTEDVLILEEELSIGESEGAEEYMFSQIRRIAVDDNERIYVLDNKESHVKVFDQNGDYLMTIGSQGEGPGELNMPRRISLNQKELMVLEIRRRLSFFTLDGEFLRNVSTKQIWTLVASIDSMGNIVVTEGLMDPENISYRVKKFDSDMNFIKEIASSPAPDARKGFNPFMAVSYWVLDSNDNIIFGYPKDYVIQIYNPECKLIKKITKEYDPVELTEEEKEEETEDAPANMKFVFSKYHSAFRLFLADDERRICVQSWEKIPDGEGYYYDIFDAEGKYIVKIPLKMRPLVWKNNKIYTIEEDEEGFQIVKRYKVNWNI